MTIKTELLLVRHGETLWNREHRIQGQLDISLSDIGEKQANTVAEKIQNFPADVFISSDLQRAMQTANIIRKKLPYLPNIQQDPGLRERHLGILQSLTWKEIEKTHRQQDIHCSLDYHIPQAETLREFYQRTIACLEKIAHNNAGKSILIVAHRGIISNIIHHAQNIDFAHDLYNHIPNTGVFPIEYQQGTWKADFSMNIK
jgi:probable phosphoglycerate mutase